MKNQRIRCSKCQHFASFSETMPLAGGKADERVHRPGFDCRKTKLSEDEIFERAEKQRRQQEAEAQRDANKRRADAVPSARQHGITVHGTLNPMYAAIIAAGLAPEIDK